MPVSSDLFVLYIYIYYFYYFSMPVSFLKRDRKSMVPGGRRSREKLRGIGKWEAVIRIYYMKKIHFQ